MRAPVPQPPNHTHCYVQPAPQRTCRFDCAPEAGRRRRRRRVPCHRPGPYRDHGRHSVCRRNGRRRRRPGHHTAAPRSQSSDRRIVGDRSRRLRLRHSGRRRLRSRCHKPRRPCANRQTHVHAHHTHMHTHTLRGISAANEAASGATSLHALNAHARRANAPA